MVCNSARAAQLTPFDSEANGGGVVGGNGVSSSAGGGGDDGFYEGRLPVHSSDSSYSTHVFTMDAQTGAYTFGYDTGNI